MKRCPFNKEECTRECALFIAPDDINENMSARLNSLGVYDKQNGLCSLKGIALSTSRFIFEKTTTRG